MVKITVLHKELPEFVDEDSGFSLLIENNSRILFDTSYSNQIIENAAKAGIDLDVDYIVLSHGHIDHTEGLKYIDLENKTIIAHPDCFQMKYLDGEIGCPVRLTELKKKTKVILSRQPYWIDKKTVFLGEIKRETDFEGKNTVGYLKDNTEDLVKDDTAIAIKTSQGLIIVSGCSHSGICNIIEYAKKVCKENIHAVIGGFHLFDKKTTHRTIEYFKTNNINRIYPLHCLKNYAFKEFEKIGAQRLHTLQELSFDS